MKRWTYSSLDGNNGVALLLAVTVISLLVAVTVQFSKEMRQELMGSANYLSSGKLGAMVKSGYNIGAALLQFDGTDNAFDSTHDNWANVGGLARLYGGANLSITINDLGGKIQLNSLVDSKGKSNGKVAQQTRAILKNLLLSANLEEFGDNEVTLIVDAITDWIDPNNEESGIEETENNYYQGLQPSYNCKNAPLEFMEELLLVRGITTELYYGSGEFSGLRELVTVHGDDGRVNINTAPSAVLQALSTEMTDEFAADLIEFRASETNKDLLGNTSWHTTVLPGDIQIATESIAVVSNYFQISATAAERGGMQKNLRAVVHRQPDNAIVMISRKIE